MRGLFSSRNINSGIRAYMNLHRTMTGGSPRVMTGNSPIYPFLHLNTTKEGLSTFVLYPLMMRVMTCTKVKAMPKIMRTTPLKGMLGLGNTIVFKSNFIC